MDTEKKYAAYREDFRLTFGLAGEHAKWLLSTLLLINSGAIAGIFQKDKASDYLAALCFFGGGVFFALISGVLGWFNLQLAAKYYYEISDDVLTGREIRPRPSSVNKMRFVAVIAAFLSIGCLIVGATLIALASR
jgi:hypothetical protein